MVPWILEPLHAGRTEYQRRADLPGGTGNPGNDVTHRTAWFSQHIDERFIPRNQRNDFRRECGIRGWIRYWAHSGITKRPQYRQQNQADSNPDYQPVPSAQADVPAG